MLGLIEVRFAGGADLMAMVTVFEVAPPIEIDTGTALPPGAPGGTCTFTWYSPTAPGERPENKTGAKTPPMLTVGVVVVGARVVIDAGAPVAGWLVTAPRPVQ